MIVTTLLVLTMVAPPMQETPTGAWPAEGRFATGEGFWQGGSATDGTHLYVLGGGPNQWSLRRYDPATDAWEWRSGMPQGNFNFRAVHCDGSLYVLGNGWFGDGYVWRYEIALDQWSGPVAELSGRRFQVAGAVLGRKIYIAGGISAAFGQWSTAFEILDTETFELASGPNMPQPQGLGVGVGLLGRAYFIAGQGPQGPTNTCFEFDPEANNGQGAWSTKAPVTIGSQAWSPVYAGGFALGNRIYVTGGQTQNNQFPTTVLEYSPSRDIWIQRASMNTGRYAHAAEAINGRAYIYGGNTQVRNDLREEFVPPDFGSAPTRPTVIGQIGPQASSSEQGGWTNNVMRFEAEIKDPDANQQVRLEIQIRRVGTSSWGTLFSSGSRPQGIVGVDVTLPQPGSYDWRWRVADAFDNYTPSLDGVPQWADAFDNTTSPDFHSDQTAPAQPIALGPSDTDVSVASPTSGPVTLTWVESTDNGPQNAIRYEIQVARDGGFHNIEAFLTSSAGNSSLEVELTVARTDKFWRLRARDIGGNPSAWSDPRKFRVVHDDRVNHSSGDAGRFCGFSAGSAAGAPMAAALGALLLLSGLVRRMRAH